MHKLKQYSRRECIEIAGILSCITKDLLGKQVLLIFEKLCVALEAMGTVACNRLGKTKRVVIKLLNRKESKDILVEKYKLKNIVLYNESTMRARATTEKGKPSLMKVFPIENFMVS